MTATDLPHLNAGASYVTRDRESRERVPRIHSAYRIKRVSGEWEWVRPYCGMLNNFTFGRIRRPTEEELDTRPFCRSCFLGLGKDGRPKPT